MLTGGERRPGAGAARGAARRARRAAAAAWSRGGRGWPRPPVPREPRAGCAPEHDRQRHGARGAVSMSRQQRRRGLWGPAAQRGAARGPAPPRAAPPGWALAGARAHN
ncbi:hypothetical protein Rsub_09934 [Raphidocelis subcapitata]|uniref:Uncharacterized protein n=1 Tax=Raphidocelis subcapitata TaxID=307507 RepID=A0A2V0PH47_9CHLO|nr:hypothetical protein Rsub_09934 [Raphidocelis subcapitata]|eukprot:GBF97243.1 hypothetical protein Rsub_09934 [Raphidocelis subcapitata]